jgi:hypothetical protein
MPDCHPVVQASLKRESAPIRCKADVGIKRDASGIGHRDPAHDALHAIEYGAVQRLLEVRGA